MPYIDNSKPFIVGLDVVFLASGEKSTAPHIFQAGHMVYPDDVTGVEKYLDSGKFYEVKDVQPDAGRIVIIDETGKEGWYNVKRFRPLPF